MAKWPETNNSYDSSYEYEKYGCIPLNVGEGLRVIKRHFGPDGCYTEYNFIDGKGKTVCDKWFASYRNFDNGYAMVLFFGYGYNFINRKGKLLAKEFFTDAEPFYEGYSLVYARKGYNFINTKGRFLSKTFFKYAQNFYQGKAEVSKDGKNYYYIGLDGKPLQENDEPVVSESVNRAKNLIGRLELIQ